MELVKQTVYLPIDKDADMKTLVDESADGAALSFKGGIDVQVSKWLKKVEQVYVLTEKELREVISITAWELPSRPFGNDKEIHEAIYQSITKKK